MNVSPAYPDPIPEAPIHIVPFSEDALHYAVRLIRQQYRDQWPDLSSLVVLLPDHGAIPRLRRLLLDQGPPDGDRAILGPHILTLRDYANGFLRGQSRRLSDIERELLIVEALQQHGGLIKGHNAWYLAEHLARLFDELTLHDAHLGPGIEDFTRGLAGIYGLENPTFGALTQEATLVYTLWEAWIQQQRQQNSVDRHRDYIQRLSGARDRDEPWRFMLIGFITLLPAEIGWLTRHLDKGRATLVVHGPYEPERGADAVHPATLITRLLATVPELRPHSPGITRPPDRWTAFLDAAFAGTPVDNGASTHLRQRAEAFAEACPSDPTLGRLAVFEASNAEDEAKAIDIQIRSWLAAGRRDIGVICQDLRLSRRVRALLDRAGIRPQEAAGWALSTTSAGAALDGLLQVVEQDAHHLPLLDLMKSPFILPEIDREALLRAAYHLEQDIVIHEQVPSEFARYRHHIHLRGERLPWSGQERDTLLRILDILEAALSPLIAISRQAVTDACDLFRSLRDAMQALGMHHGFRADAAGQCILDALEEMGDAIDRVPLRIGWSDFRAWLGRVLERATFRVPAANCQVHFLSFAHSHLRRFDGLLIAAADKDHLPLPAPGSPYFNHEVRRVLGLPDRRQSQLEGLFHFRGLLECASEVVVTLHKSAGTDLSTRSPWLSLIEAFHYFAYHTTLSDARLTDLVRHPQTEIRHRDEVPRSRTRRPAPTVPVALLPTAYSATSYQRLIDCPYQFFAAECLGLTAPESVREALEKSDYGERIHQILRLFHERDGTRDQHRSDPAGREHDIDRLTRISRKVFADDIAEKFAHHVWLNRWLALIPEYIDWQRDRARHWRVSAVEAQIKDKPVSDDLHIKGRIDRIDQGPDGTAIIDYKTGKSPSQRDTDAGESVQLAFYASLLDTVPERAEYLVLDTATARTGASLEGDQLKNLCAGHIDRLRTIHVALQQGAALPAWEDEESCNHCPMTGLCRRQVWSNASD